MEKKGITIYDIAQEAQVSPATVSRVLTNSVNVRAEKKERILEVIKKYNYKPNALARGLSDTKTKVIGILTADIRNPFYAAVFVACEKAAIKEGYTLILCNSLNDNGLEEHYLGKMEEQRVDGILLVGGRVDELISDASYVEHVNRISNNIPVIVTGKLDGTDCYQVNIDQVQAMELVMTHLMELGHSKIALLGGHSSVKSTFEKRQRYRQLLNKNAIAYNGEFVSVDMSYDDTSGYQEMNRLFNLGVLPTAVIAINDYAAIGIIRSIVEHNLKVPGNISVASFDNTFFSGMSAPELTSIDYNYELFGATLIKTVINIIEGKDVPRVQHIKANLVKRNSCSEVK